MNKNISIITQYTVPFYDLDPMNIVWHGNYIKYLEIARCDFFKNIKYTYDEMYKNNIIYPIVKLEIKYVKSAYFGEELEIVTTLVETDPALIFKYKILDKQTKKVICTAKTMQLCVNRTTNETIVSKNEELSRKIDEFNK